MDFFKLSKLFRGATDNIAWIGNSDITEKQRLDMASNTYVYMRELTLQYREGRYGSRAGSSCVAESYLSGISSKHESRVPARNFDSTRNYICFFKGN